VGIRQLRGAGRVAYYEALPHPKIGKSTGEAAAQVSG
jgi:hypothetical protein